MLDLSSSPHDDAQLCELLERYLATQGVDQQRLRGELLSEFPQLAGMLDCLDTLDKLAPAPPPSAPVSNADPDATILNSADGLLANGRVTSHGSITPRSFGNYELLEEIGRGGMGVVFRAKQRDLDRVVALKMILSSQLATGEEVRRFHAEAKAAGSLRHPHVVGIHEAGQIDGQHYFTMDFVSGTSLAELLRSGPLPPEEAAACLVTVARAVDYLHTRNIVHRDLKPSNILLDGSRRPFVTDFGLAKVFDDAGSQTQTGTIVGTPSYMAPEQAAGRHSEISSRTDVYSLGAILYEMLTGRPPFKEPNPLDTLVQVLEGEPTLLHKLNARVPRELEWICLKCLEKNAAARYVSAAALADDLEHYLRREPTDARPTGLAQHARRWFRREPGLVSRLVAMLAAATIVQVNYSLHGSDFAYHLRVMSVFAGWAVVGFLFQFLMNRGRIAEFARYAWLAADAGLLTVLLYLTESPLGALLIGYPLLVTASGMFFSVRLVAFMTAACLVAYTVLLRLRPEEANPLHYAVLFGTVLAVLGSLVAYQVFRVRVLSKYYERRKLD